MIRIPVAIPGREYQVTVGAGLLSEAADHIPELNPAEKAFAVADQEVAALYLGPLAAALEKRGLQVMHLPIPQGEGAKSLAVAEALFRQLALQEAHRDDVVVALGGGVAGDLAGFVAATYMRGVRLLSVPTTLTAQVDAAVGGKTAVNLPEGKNLVGAFHQPVGVLADVETLATLPDREFRSGLAEVAKVGLALDPAVLEVLEGSADAVLRRDPLVLENLVARCVKAKAQVVGADERDAGARLVLNYGHTLGHALERLEEFGRLSHGEAVAVGMVFAARLSQSAGVTEDPDLLRRHVRLLRSLGLPAGGPIPEPGDLVEAMRLDKKHRHGFRFVLLESVGKPRVVSGVPEEVVVRTLGEMQSG